MARKYSKSVLLAIGLAVLIGPLAQAQSNAKEKEKEKEQERPATKDVRTKLRIEVTGGEKSAPVDSASVYVKFQEERFLAKDKMIEMNVKTTREGIAKVPAVPRGKVLIQVFAQGWKTFGQWYELTEEEQTIKINLQKPPRWY